jgi:hypothetical protein
MTAAIKIKPHAPTVATTTRVSRCRRAGEGSQIRPVVPFPTKLGVEETRLGMTCKMSS